MKLYFKKILFLLSDDRRKIPWMIILFLCSSFLDLVGLGLVGPYIALVVAPDSINDGVIHNLIVFMGFPLQHEILLIWLGISLIGVFLFKAIIAIFINRTIIIFSNNQQIRLKSILMVAYQLMPYNDFLKRNSAEYINTISGYTNVFSSVVQTILKTISDGIMALAILITLAFTNGPALGLLVSLLGGMVLVFDKIFKKKLVNYGKKTNKADIYMIQGLQEGIEGLKEIRILGKEKQFHQKVLRNAIQSAKYRVKSQLINTAPRFLLEFMLVIFVVAIVNGSLLIGQNLQLLIPTLGMFGFAALRLMPATNVISTSLINIRYHRHSVSRLYSELKSLPKKTSFKKLNNSGLNNQNEFKNLTLRNVSFKYQNTKNMALNSVDFDIIAGESIGLIGPSGSGKTTMVDILLGLLDPQEGKIKYNGKPLIESLDKWRSQVAYLPQNVFLIDNSLRSNIALGLEDEDINDLKIHKAINQARLKIFVEELPNGLDTMIGERGVRLSGGQRQRVALARAFYHDRSVLVMDEATSSLDNETEGQIIDEIKHLKGKKTMIVIAHRLSTVQHCDRVYRLEKAEISHHGTLDQVLNNIK